MPSVCAKTFPNGIVLLEILQAVNGLVPHLPQISSLIF
jgi:hypothetical protein